MILHASLKTDIAQFYSSWILNRLKAGYIDIENGKFIDRYYFKKNNLEKIYFWSKDPQPLIKRISELISCEYDFEIITEMSFYDKCYEPKIKSKQKIFSFAFYEFIDKLKRQISDKTVFSIINK